MADIQVRIKLNAGVDGDQINSVAFSQETNNVSKVVGSKTTKNDGQNLISWGEKGLIYIDEDGRVGGAGTLGEQNGYNGFVFGVVPENKMYSVEITLEGSNIDSVTFYGDKTANQFPTRAIVNGEYIYSDDAEWTIAFPNASNTQTITFDMWNRGNYNACFTHIGVFANELILDKRWIKSVETLSQSTGQPKEIYYGITPSSGNVEILDINGEIKDYIQDGILDNNVNIEILSNGNNIQKHITTDSSYKIESKTIELSLSNKLSSWSKINHSAMGLINECSLYDILKFVLMDSIYNSENEILDMLKSNIFTIDGEMTIYQYLTNIKIKYPYLEKSFVRDTIDKICQIAQLNVYENNDGQIIFSSSRPHIN